MFLVKEEYVLPGRKLLASHGYPGTAKYAATYLDQHEDSLSHTCLQKLYSLDFCALFRSQRACAEDSTGSPLGEPPADASQGSPSFR